MRYSLYILSLFVLLLTSCNRPDGVLSAGKMEDVLYDIHRADGILYVKGYDRGKAEKAGKYYEVVLQKHGVTQAQFDSSLVWYTDHPKRFDKIYPRVLERLEEEKERLHVINEALAENKKPQEDTIPALPKRTFDEWLQIMQEGLPIEWKYDTIVIDTAFVYPYLQELQDSIQQAVSGIVQDSLPKVETSQPATPNRTEQISPREDLKALPVFENAGERTVRQDRILHRPIHNRAMQSE